MKVSVIIPVYNRADLLPAVIKALLDQEYPAEIIIVDDGSTDSTAEVAKGCPVKYIYQENAGPAKARNTGWKASTGDIVCFTDSDCIPQKDWTGRLAEGFIEDSIGAVGGSYDIANPESLLSRCIHEEIKLRHLKLGAMKYIRAFGSYNVAIKRHVLEETGGFNEEYRTASGEDNDLSYRIITAGYNIKFQGKALVAHHHTERLCKYLKEQYRHGYWRMKLYKDFPDMTKGDDYTSLKDIIEPPLGLLSAFSVFFLWNKYGVVCFFALLVFNAAIQMPAAVRLIKSGKDFRYLYLAVVTFFRAYERAFGMFRGILKFWV